MRLLPAVRFRGLHYAHPDNHASALELAAHSEGMTFSELTEVLLGGEHVTYGYENEEGEFTTQAD